jgi:hypothetical protein
MNSRSFVAAAALVAAVSWPAVSLAQRVEQSRGNIVSIDQSRGTIELRDPQGRTGTWKFNRNATVKFTDGSSFFPNPSTADLRPPMYVHFTFSNEVIDGFDVVELGFQPGNEDSVNQAKRPGQSRMVTGRVTAYDGNVKQVELDVNGRRETFQLTDRSNQQLNPGDRVQLRTEWSGQRELVAETKVLSGGTSTRPSTSGGGSSGGGSSSAQQAEGEVVRISPRGVVMQVAGAEQTYVVANSSLLQRLRVGNVVRFSWENRSGRLYITDVR